MSSLRPPRRWQLDLAFYVIAAIGVLAIVATTYLGAISGVVDAGYAFAAAMLILVAGSAFVGARVHRLTRDADDHRRRYLEATGARGNMTCGRPTSGSRRPSPSARRRCGSARPSSGR